ncbi:S-adenosyl-L-methionine-dependent methyltransferase [Rhexocercosporidium sp. MPI-PUGE-AT-0058]|nr:S-adenosyl-L-methionine-dependent methyltransferase [Rhexocercosporidium sp. MPI-PUGE-AT-0058]
MAAPTSPAVGDVPPVETSVQETEAGQSATHVLDEGNQLVADLESTDDDNDSAVGSDDSQSIKTSLSSSIARYRIENGRSYDQYKDGQYAYPNDEIVLVIINRPGANEHWLTRIIRSTTPPFKLMMDQSLYLSPIKKNPQNVLDIGTGTGLWAIEFADENPSATVIGTDLSPIQPTFVPPNLSFMIDDAGEEWVFPQKFDFIHARQLHCAVEEKRLIEQALTNLKPGGFFEMQELCFPSTCDASNPPTNAFSTWNALMLEASIKMGQPLNNPPKYAEWMRDAGFTDGKKEKTLGLWNMVNTLDGLDGFTMAMFTRVLGWSPEEVTVFLVGVRADCKNKALHNYWPVYNTYGQKPL